MFTRRSKLIWMMGGVLLLSTVVLGSDPVRAQPTRTTSGVESRGFLARVGNGIRRVLRRDERATVSRNLRRVGRAIRRELHPPADQHGSLRRAVGLARGSYLDYVAGLARGSRAGSRPLNRRERVLLRRIESGATNAVVRALSRRAATDDPRGIESSLDLVDRLLGAEYLSERSRLRLHIAEADAVMRMLRAAERESANGEHHMAAIYLEVATSRFGRGHPLVEETRTVVNAERDVRSIREPGRD